jgi:putative transposase
MSGRERPLATVAEVVELTGASLRTVRRWTKLDTVYVEYRQVVSPTGRSIRTAYMDLATLPCDLSADAIALHMSTKRSELATAKVLPSETLVMTSLEQAVEQLAAIPVGERKPHVAVVAKRFGVSRRTVYRRLSRRDRPPARTQRADVGRPRIPPVARELIVRALVTNEPTTSVPMIHRTLLRAAPDAMTYERGGAEQVVSVQTVRRVRDELLANPRSRLLLANADERAEYLRVFSGAVIAEHANALWQMDMTRCDILVWDPAAGRSFRPRVHAIIDVHSDVIVGIAFSQEEGQAQTDLTLLRALLPKQGPFADRYPYWGVPQRMYWDNGSTYKSSQAQRVLAGLGIEDVHSRPYVSHTRGDIERFFGTLHNLEKALPGYVGPNAVARASKEIKRLESNTRNWHRHGRDPGDGNRLLTINEYQNIVLAWLVTEYHQGLVDGVSRHERFVSTAPASTLVEIDRAELLVLLAHRVERTVDAGGRIRLENRHWTVPDGSLAAYQGMRVLVLTDQFALEPERRLVAWVNRLGALEVIGEALPAPQAAASIEAQDQRRAARAVLVEENRRQREMKRELTDPNVRVSTVLLKEFRAAGGEELPAAARAQLEVLNPAKEVIEFAPDDVIGQRLANPLSRFADAPSDPIERIRWANEHLGKGRNK